MPTCLQGDSSSPHVTLIERSLSTENDSTDKYRKEDCVFNPGIFHEEIKLLSLLDNNCKAKLYRIYKAVYFEVFVNESDFSKDGGAVCTLKTWQRHVEVGLNSWRHFYDVLLKLDCPNAAQQFKVVYEKDRLVSDGKFFLLYIFKSCKNILEKLASLEVIDIQEKSELIAKDCSNLELVQSFASIMLSKSYEHLARFHRVLRKEKLPADTINGLVLLSDNTECCVDFKQESVDSVTDEQACKKMISKD